ncbi:MULTISPECIES: MoaD/ThiS family protein [Thermococcus]|uniref:MoaD/ThiS family protein n=1 Tax=Thermococcus aciditolerans TaxID=2598455 RepID=A0A5C0SQ46_9EURY|nr:MoaD/ThiS family protein [Thermococcus aciditolerans]
MRVTLILYGEHALKHGSRRELEVEEGKRVGELLRELGIGTDEHHILVNEKRVEESHPLSEGDRIKVLPVVYGGSFARPVDAGHVHGEQAFHVPRLKVFLYFIR